MITSEITFRDSTKHAFLSSLVSIDTIVIKIIVLRCQLTLYCVCVYVCMCVSFFLQLSQNSASRLHALLFFRNCLQRRVYQCRLGTRGRISFCPGHERISQRKIHLGDKLRRRKSGGASVAQLPRDPRHELRARGCRFSTFAAEASSAVPPSTSRDYRLHHLSRLRP